ncbi:hypothetical protein Tco_0939196 [Tanacetum coccineum]|uniref:Uncharacterized protein n=1 Tax=Tanacetum coccineum TaxID=301880 RepID=A0ABQ5DM29_9ASTR
MKAEVWTLIDNVWSGYSLAENVAYNVVNEKTTYGLIKALSNMYEKPSASNKGYFQNQYSKLVASTDKEVNITAGDSDDALVCCVENTIEVNIIDSGASFHATYCKEELERFKLRSGKTLKDVRYIRGLKRRLILVGQLDEEGYYIGFGDQQWKVTKGSLVVARGNKRESLYMVEVHSEGIGAIIDGSGNAALWFGEAEEDFLYNFRKDEKAAEAATAVAVGNNANLQVKCLKFDNSGEYKASKKLWADSVSMTYLIYFIPYVLIGLRIPEEEW